MSSCRKSRRPYGLKLHVVEKGISPEQGSNGDETVAKINTEIRFNPGILDTYHYEGWKPVHYDLLVVCAAVEFADRRCGRRATRWSRRFQVTLPVLELAAWRQPEVQVRLQDTLRHLTGDEWHFFFVQAANSTDCGAHQRSLPFHGDEEFAIAYSDGLDSRCVSGIFDTGDSVIRVRVTRTRNQIANGEHPFDQIPFQVKVVSSRLRDVRSRAFKFAAIVAIAGHLSGVRRILVPESGQDALGPVLLPLHNVYADYRNHPTFFRRMERFIEALLGYSVAYKQPRLWYTKSETIADFLARPGIGQQSVLSTRSCWQQRWNAIGDGKRTQCGLCAACLLRRMSMHAAGVDEPTDAYTIGDLKAASYDDAVLQGDCKRLSKTMVEYGIVGARHLQQLAELAGLPDPALRVHVFEIARATGDSEQDTGYALRRLLVRHAEEWRDFVSAQGQRSFMGSWTK